MTSKSVGAQFVDRFFTAFTGRVAERVFKEKVAECCVGLTPAHIQRAAESSIPFEELIARAGFKLKSTPESELNAWQKHLVSLPEERLLELVREAVSPAHAHMLDRYPQVAHALVGVVKNFVVPG